MDEHLKNIGMRATILKTSLKVLAILVILMGIAAPAMAGERFVSGGPNLTAAILGSNDFSPGEDITIPVTIQNSGLLEYVFTYPNQMTAADLPNTAKLMTVTLGPGDAPVTIKSDPQLLGDLAGGRNTVVNFKVKIAPDAPHETYNLPLTIRYTYLMRADQYGTDVLQYFYKEQEETLRAIVSHLPGSVLIKPSLDGKSFEALRKDSAVAFLRTRLYGLETQLQPFCLERSITQEELSREHIESSDLLEPYKGAPFNVG